MEKVDLHIHSKESDGTYTAKEIANMALKQSLKAIALTDHDTVAGIDECVDEGKNIGVEVIPGIELSCFHKKEIHIVGLNINHKDKTFLDKISNLQKSREERNLKIMQKLWKHGINLDIEELKLRHKCNIVGRLHIAKSMVEKGYIDSYRNAFKYYLGSEGKAYVEGEKLNFKECADIVESAGGVPILAHPAKLYNTTSEFDELISELVKQGLKGIEVFCSANRICTNKYLSNIAKKHGLLMSGGSDFHGENSRYVLGEGLGSLSVSYTLLDKIKDFSLRNIK